jgi:DNA-binding XRE family transcriptional regulator
MTEVYHVAQRATINFFLSNDKLIAARAITGLTQEEVATKMHMQKPRWF